MENRISAQLTQHALRRRQQRGIDPLAIDLLLAYGAERRSRGASLYFLTGATRRRLDAEIGKGAANRILQKMNLLVVENDDGDVVTVAHRTRRTRNHVARRANRQH